MANNTAPTNLILLHNANFEGLRLYQYTEMYIWSGIALPILYLGAFGNCLTLAVIVRARWWRTGIQVLITSLTVSDILGTAIVYPHQLFNIIFGATFPWSFRPFCRWSGYISMITYYLVPVHCCMIALNRFFSIVLPGRFSFLTSRRAGIIMSIYCWALPSVFFAFPLAEVDGKFTNGKPFGHCTWAGYMGSRLLSYLVTCSTVYVPTVVIFSCYFSVYLYLKRVDRKVFEHGIQRGTSEIESRRKEMERRQRRAQVAKMMMVTFVVFLICYLPINSFFYLAHDINRAPNPTVFLWMLLLFWMSGCCNTVIYSVMNKDYRDGYGELLRHLHGVLCCRALRITRQKGNAVARQHPPPPAESTSVNGHLAASVSLGIVGTRRHSKLL